MMKFYKKKEISQEETPILFRLERRHTVLEGGPQETSDDEPKGRASRANSVGSFTRCETPTDEKKRAATISKLCASDDNRSNFSAASTVVITESELSSSWLYKARKAKIDSEDEENVSTCSNIPNEDNDMQPVPLNDPKLKPVPVPMKPRKENVSSCCCYFLVAITICIASLGIMAAIGGIVYLEVFAHYREIIESQHTTPTPTLDAAMGRKGKIGSSLENKVSNFGAITSSSSSEVKYKDVIVSPKNPTHMFIDEPSIENIPVIGELDPSEKLNIQSKLDKITEHQELKDDLKSLSDKIETENNEAKVSSGKDTKYIEKNDSLTTAQVSSDTVNDNLSMKNQDVDEIAGISKDNPNFGTVYNTRFPRMEEEIAHKNFQNERLDIDETGISSDEGPESENAFEPQLRNIYDYDDSFVQNRPIVEARPPIEFIKRLVGNRNPDLNDLSIKDMDQKYTLSEILKHLRTLDSNNRLPSSRQKDGVTETLKLSTRDIGLERNEYLDKLRRKIYS
ncbi:hypothetical protein JTE90_021834 [Oedothorax gibbosus]|uniref:Uncharacterized protein n=1 Tax=Oedothorax gibbosus TaxID=931172 RepID=A0AAV6V044_9ARAC|nr:hypothetical protein JTE90_021834 [Oedothorax gibbosus]